MQDETADKATSEATSEATNTAFTEAMILAIVDDDGDVTSVEASFAFDPSDPYAMTILLPQGPAAVRWTFARDLFIDGFFEPTGDGDIHVFPCLSTECGAVVILDLNAPSGSALVQIGSRAAAEFIERMVASVPRGTESALLDFDAELAELLEAS